jgi:mono/diheme cytochrome c family protein
MLKEMKAPFLATASCVLALLSFAACSTPVDSETRPLGETAISPAALKAARSGPVDFVAHVKPILEAKCAMCHNQNALPGKMDLSSQEAAARTGAIGTWIVAGHPDQSLLVTKIHDTPAHLQAMPPVGQQITPDEINLLRKWIAEGAPWPAAPRGALNTGD